MASIGQLIGDRMRLEVKRWRGHGLERLYVNDTDANQTAVGYYDCKTGASEHAAVIGDTLAQIPWRYRLRILIRLDGAVRAAA